MEILQRMGKGSLFQSLVQIKIKKFKMIFSKSMKIKFLKQNNKSNRINKLMNFNYLNKIKKIKLLKI